MYDDSAQDYSYTDSGLDGFLSRSIDDLSQVNLSSQGPQSMSMAYDRAQVTGSLGNIIQIGKVRVDGVTGRISIVDDSGNETVRIGELDD